MYPNGYNYYPQSQNPYLNRYMPTNQYVQQPQGLKGRPVSSLEEVRATGIDFDGSVSIFQTQQTDVSTQNKLIQMEQLH